MSADLPQSLAAQTSSKPGSASSAASLSKSHEPSVMDKHFEAGTDTDPKTVEAGANVAELEKQEKIDLQDTEEVDEKIPIGAQSPIDEIEYPTSWKLTLISVALCLSVFCMALDNTIIATALPRITDQFNALDDIGWFTSVYLLTTCAFQLIYGKIYSFYSIKWTYMFALFIFELGSLICGIAPNATALIFGRAIAGLGSAGIFTGAILIISFTVPLSKRPLYMGLVGGMYGIASVAGPLMGGAFTDKLTWRWCFYINLPFGGVTALFIIFFFQSPKREKKVGTFWEKLNQMDLYGTFFFLPGVVCLLLALQWGGSKYAWKSGRIIALLCLAGVLLLTFVVIQVVRGEKATVPPRVFKRRSIFGAALYAAFLGAAFFVVLFYLPIWFQAIKGASAVKSGIMQLPLILTMVIVSIIVGGVITSIGHYVPFMWLTVILAPIGTGLLSTLKPTSPHAQWMGYQAIIGIGIGAGFQQPLLAAQATLPLEDVPIGTAIMMLFQIFGGAIFSSVAQNVFNNQLLQNVRAAAPGYDPTPLLSAGATQVQALVPAEYKTQVILAYNKAIDQTFYVPVAMSALMIFPLLFVEWKSVKGMQLSPGAV